MSLNAQISRAKAASKAAADEINSGIVSIRSRIADLQEEVRTVANSPVPIDQALSRVDEWVGISTAQYLKMAPQPSEFAASSGNYRMPGFKPDVTLVWLLADKLAVEAKRHVSDYYRHLTPLSDEERDLRLAALDRKLLDCELTEESMIRQAEDAGFPICRRDDADPRAVLAHDKVLP